MKKLLALFLLVCSFAIGARAQFEEGTSYVSTQLSSLNLSFSEQNRFRFAMSGHAGYFFTDGWMAHANVGFEHIADKIDKFNIGAGLRYHFYENGISLGTGIEYTYLGEQSNNLRLPLEVGYVYYLNHYLAIEPTLYYKVSLNNISKGSELGFRIGLGYYF